jgi:hypothetical protein
MMGFVPHFWVFFFVAYSCSSMLSFCSSVLILAAHCRFTLTVAEIGSSWMILAPLSWFLLLVLVLHRWLLPPLAVLAPHGFLPLSC